jgi:hypothetical protein
MASFPLQNLYAVTYPGCCGALDTTKYFSLSSGKLIGASTEKPLVIEISNPYEMRYIMTQDARASDYLGKRQGVATIFYSDNEKIRQEVSIVMPDAPKTRCTLFSLRLSQNKNSIPSSPWNQFAVNAFDGFSITVELDCDGTDGITIDIPVISDILTANRAIVKGMNDMKIENVTHNK